LFRGLQERVDSVLSENDDPEGVVVDVDNAVDTDTPIYKNTKKMNPKGAINDPHILTTKQLNPVTCKRSEGEHVKPIEPDLDPDVPAAEGAEVRDSGREVARNSDIDIGMVMQACPQFAEMAHNLGGYIKDWNELHRIAGQVRPMVGVSEHAWGVAQESLGPAAAAAMALIFDKFSDGDVASPGGYLRGMVDKAGAGELYLERSFFGRLSEARAPAHA
jgi:replication initiation protein RepC